MMNKYNITNLTIEEYSSLNRLLSELRNESRKKELKEKLEANIMTLINDIEVQTTLETSEIYEVLNEVSLNVAINE